MRIPTRQRVNTPNGSRTPSGAEPLTTLARSPVAWIALGTLVRLVLAAVVPLFPDETYYWEWSRRLAPGYFDHPPAIALLIRAGTIVAGASRFGVRLGVVMAGAVASWALVTLARRLGDMTGTDDGRSGAARAALHAAVLTTCIPVALVGFVLATPDAPLLAAVSVMLVALDRALAAPVRSSASLAWWGATGILLGVALCAKYTAVLVPFGVFVAMCASPRLRVRFVEGGPYLATLVALLVFAPVIAWNARHQWVSFAFQLRHGLGAPRGSALTRELDLVGGQIGLITPILAGVIVAAAYGVLRHRRASGENAVTLDDDRTERRFALATVALTIVAFFMVSALRKPVEANWPAPALVAALPVAAAWASSNQRGGRRQRWLVRGEALAAACTFLLVLHAVVGILPLAPRRDPVAKAYGWERLAMHVDSAYDTLVQRRTMADGATGMHDSTTADPSHPPCARTWIAADRYQDASELAFHLRGQPTVFSLNHGGRPNQYDLWPTFDAALHPGDCTLLIVDDNAQGNEVVRWSAGTIGADATDLGRVALGRNQSGRGLRPAAWRRTWLLRPP